jgi:hypothetical protein
MANKAWNIVFREIGRRYSCKKYNDLLDQTFVGPGRLTEVL